MWEMWDDGVWGRDAFCRPYGYDNGLYKEYQPAYRPHSPQKKSVKSPFSDFSRGEGGICTPAKGISAKFYPRGLYFGKILY